MNGEFSTKVASLEAELHRVRNGLTDDDRTVADLKRKIGQLEKSLSKKSQSQSPARAVGLSASTKVSLFVRLRSNYKLEGPNRHENRDETREIAYTKWRNER